MPQANELIVQALEEAGIEYVFGIPGGGTGQIFGLLHGKEDIIKTILCRHEQTAAIMADVYGRATGKPAVIMGQGLFMGSNASFGIMEAMLSSSPMVVLTDTSDGGSAQHPANQSGAGEYGSIDLPSIFKAMTKYTTLATTPKEAVIGTQLAIKHSSSGRPGPACVVMRSASISGEVDVESPPFIHSTAGYLNTAKPQSSPQDIEQAIEILRNAKRPILVAGNGVHLSKSHTQLQELAELWDMPVATSYKGKSAIAETHPLSVGMVGVYGQAAANSAVGDSDCVVIVGAKLSPQDTVKERPDVFDPHSGYLSGVLDGPGDVAQSDPQVYKAQRERDIGPGGVGQREADLVWQLHHHLQFLCIPLVGQGQADGLEGCDLVCGGLQHQSGDWRCRGRHDRSGG